MIISLFTQPWLSKSIHEGGGMGGRKFQKIWPLGLWVALNSLFVVFVLKAKLVNVFGRVHFLFCKFSWRDLKTFCEAFSDLFQNEK